MFYCCLPFIALRNALESSCTSNEQYDNNTNECYSIYIWGEMRRNVNGEFRQIYYDGLVDSTLFDNNSTFDDIVDTINCNNGNITNNGTCKCFNGWRTRFFI